MLDLQAISGHKDLRELQIYIENANRKRRAKRAIERLESTQIANKGLANLESRLANPGKSSNTFNRRFEIMVSAEGLEPSTP